MTNMQALEAIGERSHADFDERTKVRDQALAQARQLTRHAAHTIRAIHRGEIENAAMELKQAGELVQTLKFGLTDFPDLFYAGYTQDAIKEFTEASITCALIQNQELPTPEDLGVETATYWNGLAEVVGELRRRCLDILRQGYSDEAERLLGCMDEIYTNLVTMDYPDAVTQGLRRQTDLVRNIVEKTRGDLTLSLRFQLMEHALIEYTHKITEAK
ncbi:MAG TPA: haloacid dehalogenase [Leptolinea sp.]